MDPKIETIFDFYGYKCVVIKRTADSELSFFQEHYPPSYYCGYVQIPYWHPVYKKDYRDLDILCHGGLTFSDHKLLGVPYPGWWIGFDCAHEGDVVNPKDLNFVMKECISIVKQLKEME